LSYQGTILPTTLTAPSSSAALARPRGAGDDRLLASYARTRDPRMRERLAERYLPLARYAAGQYANGREPYDDLVQVASLGLLKAIDRFDPGRGAAFSSYALPTITGELRRYFRDHSWAVRPPRDLQERALAVERVSEGLARDLGRAPTVDEIGSELGLGAEVVLEAREAACARGAVSLSAPGGSGDDDDVFTIEARLGRHDDGLVAAERRATLASLTSRLQPREREIVRLRFDEDLTQSEIGQRVGLSQMHVSRILRDALNHLRAAAAAGL
jgi:RNA polymerase sigma-B factor